jgi:hypothetical protein
MAEHVMRKLHLMMIFRIDVLMLEFIADGVSGLFRPDFVLGPVLFLALA